MLSGAMHVEVPELDRLAHRRRQDLVGSEKLGGLAAKRERVQVMESKSRVDRLTHVDDCPVDHDRVRLVVPG